MNFRELIEFAKRQTCSDVHITVGTAIALRRFGKLEMLEPVPSAQQSLDMIMECLDQEQIDTVLSGKDIDFGLMMPDGTRLRCNVYHQRNNIAATYRLLNSKIPTMDELNLPEAVKKLANEPRGLVLVTGPTGSGKTTTMASMVNHINRRQPKHVITIEDPIEYIHNRDKSMIHQREVGKDVDSFATALRSALREDPDIIMVGEMRDLETISAAITAAETGHLVLSTLHTSSAAQTIDRIIDSFPPHGQQQVRIQLANILKGVVTQVLVPRDDAPGMVMATEVLINNDAIATQIRDNKTHMITSSLQNNTQSGMHTLDADLKRLVAERKITVDTALKFCNYPKLFR